MELRQGTQYWERLAKQVAHPFEFVDEHPIIDVVLQAVKERIVTENLVKDANYHQCNATIQQYSITRDPDDDLIDISRPESGGT